MYPLVTSSLTALGSLSFEALNFFTAFSKRRALCECQQPGFQTFQQLRIPAFCNHFPGRKRMAVSGFSA